VGLLGRVAVCINNTYLYDLAGALLWDAEKKPLGDTPVVGYKDTGDQVKVTLDFGIGGLKQYSALKDRLPRIMAEYRPAVLGDSRLAVSKQSSKVMQGVAFPIRLELPEPVEYLTDLTYLDGVRELHDPDANLEQYLEREPKTLEQHLGRVPHHDQSRIVQAPQGGE